MTREVMQPQAKDAGTATNSRRQEGHPPRPRRNPCRELGPGMPALQTSGLQNWGRTHFSCFKPPSLWFFVTAAPGH